MSLAEFLHGERQMITDIRDRRLEVDATEKNKGHYDALYAKVQVQALVEKIADLERFLPDAIATDTSWHAMYYGGLRDRLGGIRVIELGAGDGLNALVMAALGADVVAVDISEFTPVIIRQAAAELGLAGRLAAYRGNFLEMRDVPPRSFDLVVGKAFLHHLDPVTESRFLRRAAEVLKPDGAARFVEPAVNSTALDTLRYIIPVPGRPSSLNRRAFRAYRDWDPHPLRDNSSGHFRDAAAREFGRVEIACFGCVERLERFFPQGNLCRSFRRMAFRVEQRLPKRCNDFLARSQLIVCSRPMVRDCTGVSIGPPADPSRDSARKTPTASA